MTYTAQNSVYITCLCMHFADSRLYAGVHFRSANEDGLALGRLAGGKVYDRIKPLAASKSTSTAAATAAEKGKPATGRRMRA